MTCGLRQRYLRNLGCFLVVVLALTAAGLVVGVSWLQVDAFLHPYRRVPVETPRDLGLDYQDVVFAASDGVQLQGWYFRSENGAAVIVGHGLGGYRDLGPAAVLARHGYGVLSFDWRAHGESEGDLCTFGFHEIHDVEGALTWLQARPDVDPGRIGMLGQSMGAVAAIRAAARLTGIQVVVADSPYPSLDEAVTNVWRGTGLPVWPFVPLQIALGQWRTGLGLEEMDPLEDVAAISPRPVLILAGGLDPITGPDAGERYYAAAGEPKELWYEPNAGHLSLLRAYPAEYERRVVGFVDEALLNGQ
jgi:fermentation-respiration switch protein FrsA (DUF1100 family)